MKRLMVVGLALAVVLASTSTVAEAQLKGLLKKKAEEAVGGKKAEPAPAPAPAPAPTTTAAPAPAPAPTPASGAAATPSPAPAAAAPAPAPAPAAKTAVSPLEVSALPVSRSADQVLRGRVNLRENGEWDQLPFIPPAAVAAAYGLGDSAKVALVETVGAALKTLVMSPAYMAEHDKYIKSEFQAADHGLKGVVGLEDALKKNDLKAIEAIQAREVVAISVEQVEKMPADSRKQQFTQQLADWKAEAAKPKGRELAKYQKLVAKGQPLEGLAAGDEKFKRGYAVLLSIDNGGPDTEEAVYAIYQRATQEKEQLAYDQHNLKGQLKQQLTTFVAVAAKVNFNAPTVQKNKQTVFVNPADEKQGALWKACYRAGAAPTAAAVKLAKAWLAEL